MKASNAREQAIQEWMKSENAKKAFAANAAKLYETAQLRKIAK